MPRTKQWQPQVTREDLASHSSGIEQGSLVAHENRRDKSPSPPPSQGNEPNAKYGSPNLTRLKVKYRQADDDHPVLAGVRGPRDPNSAVEKLMRDSGYSGDAARQYDYEPTHPFHVLNRDLIWFEVLDSVPGKPCNPSCRGTIHFGRYQRGEIHYGSISQRSEVHGVAGAMCSLGQVGMVRGEEEVLGGEGLMLDVVHLKSIYAAGMRREKAVGIGRSLYIWAYRGRQMMPMSRPWMISEAHESFPCVEWKQLAGRWLVRGCTLRACSATDPDPDPELIPESKIPYIEVQWNSGISGNAWGFM
ncbi:hypothetical protein EV361DRAFT_1035045 [Lentinula raphanica]|nr:hypothetical protein EV361DRAFT_1035045 [Lentinula raphanica]